MTLDQPGRLAGGHVPARAAFPAAGPLAGDAGARPHRARCARIPGALTEIRDRPRPAGDRPFRAVARRRGVFEDGTPFSIPGETDHPAPLDLPESTRNALVYLAAPIRQPGAVEVAPNGGTEGRYGLHELRGLRHPFRLAAAGRAADRPAAAALHAGDRGPRRLSLHRPRPHHRGRGRPPGHARRPLDPARAGLLGRAAARRPDRRVLRHAATSAARRWRRG